MACSNVAFDEPMLYSLKKNNVYMVTHLESTINDILDYLYENDAGIDKETILQSSPVQKEQVRAFLTSLKLRPNHEYWIFLKSLYSEAVKHAHTAEKILRKFLEHGGTITDMEVMNLRSRYLDQHPEQLIGLPAHLLPQSHQPQRSPSLHFCTDPPPQHLAPPVLVPSSSAEEIADGPRAQLSEGSGFVACPSDDRSLQMDTDNSAAGVDSQQQHAGAGAAMQRRNVYHEKYAADEESVYKMDSTPRGIGLIIDNRSFDHLDNRDGSVEDCERLYDLFRNRLEYEVEIKINLSGMQMLGELERFSLYLNELPDKPDCSMVAVMSHGCENILFGTDGRLCERQPARGTFITIDQLKMALDGGNCTGMQEKPKMIIVQACRGIFEDTAAGLRRCQLDVVTEPDPASQRTQTVPRHANFVFLYATVEGLVAYRNLFIQILVDVFQNNAHSTHVSDLRTIGLADSNEPYQDHK